MHGPASAILHTSDELHGAKYMYGIRTKEGLYRQAHKLVPLPGARCASTTRRSLRLLDAWEAAPSWPSALGNSCHGRRDTGDSMQLADRRECRNILGIRAAPGKGYQDNVRDKLALVHTVSQPASQQEVSGVRGGEALTAASHWRGMQRQPGEVQAGGGVPGGRPAVRPWLHSN